MSAEKIQVLRTYGLKDIPFLPPFDISRGTVHTWKENDVILAEISNGGDQGLTVKLFGKSNQQEPESETQIGSLAGKVILIGQDLDQRSREDLKSGGFVELVKTPEGNNLSLTLCYPDTLTGNDPNGFVIYGVERMDPNSVISLEITRNSQ